MQNELLTFVQDTAVSAGKLTLEKWQEPLTISEKGYHDLVTSSDIAAQAHIAKRVMERYPTHGFLGEEDDDSLPSEGELIWIIDPIDGTTNYSRHQPQFAVSIGVGKPIQATEAHLTQYELLAGAIYDPGRDELFSAAKGEGAWLNGRSIKASGQTELEHAIIGMDFSTNKRTGRSSKDVALKLANQIHGIRVLGSAAIAIAWVTAGRFDAYINYNLKPWDVAAGFLLATEAGGAYTNDFGEPIIWDRRGMDCVISTGQFHQDIIKALQA
ncbi:MAG: inositol monophosphatase family protein [Chloroflexota bacterium]